MQIFWIPLNRFTQLEKKVIQIIKNMGINFDGVMKSEMKKIPNNFHKS